MLKCFAVENPNRNFDNLHILQAIADEAGVDFEPGSGGRSYLGVPSCTEKKEVMEVRLQVEELVFQELPRIAY